MKNGWKLNVGGGNRRLYLELGGYAQFSQPEGPSLLSSRPLLYPPLVPPAAGHPPVTCRLLSRALADRLTRAPSFLLPVLLASHADVSPEACRAH